MTLRWCLSYISDGTSDDIQEALDLMISDRLVELMGHAAWPKDAHRKKHMICLTFEDAFTQG